MWSSSYCDHLEMRETFTPGVKPFTDHVVLIGPYDEGESVIGYVYLFQWWSQSSTPGVQVLILDDVHVFLMSKSCPRSCVHVESEINLDLGRYIHNLRLQYSIGGVVVRTVSVIDKTGTAIPVCNQNWQTLLMISKKITFWLISSISGSLRVVRCF